jgi:carbonic anhydrase/acetyltransferase-like protein (isoleucine patch superfamily)
MLVKKSSVRVAATASVSGDVSLGQNVSVWHGAVVRADEAPISVGESTNVQDNAVIHVSPQKPVKLGRGVTIGHGAIVHGCEVGDNSLIGMGAIVLDGAVIGRDCIIGAGALVTQGVRIPDGSVAFGNPARVVRQIRPEEIASNRQNAQVYVELASEQLPEYRNESNEAS